ncbi:MAG: hypothetical protein AAGF71_02360 [Pseudomonadota bacterium]
MNDDTASLILFLALFPLVNAIFDYLSLGLTRFTLRRSLSSSWHVAIFWYVVDLVFALVAFVVLIIALMLGVHILNIAAGIPLLDLGQFFADIDDPAKDMTWAYLMVFSTLLPTVAHALFFYFGLALRIPGPGGGVWLARIIGDSDQQDDRRLFVKLMVGGWFGLAALLLVGLYTGVTYLFGGGHGELVHWVADQAEAFARALKWIAP